MARHIHIHFRTRDSDAGHARVVASARQNYKNKIEDAIREAAALRRDGNEDRAKKWDAQVDKYKRLMAGSDDDIYEQTKREARGLDARTGDGAPLQKVSVHPKSRQELEQLLRRSRNRAEPGSLP